MNNQKFKVLVLDANQRSSLAVIRSLGSLDNVQIFTSDSTVKAIGGCSKYSQKYLRYPEIEKAPFAFLNWLEEVIKSLELDFLMPCTEMSSQIILMNRTLFEGTSIPFDTLENVMAIADKSNLVNIARRIDIASPKSIHYDRASDVDTLQFTQYPIVIKPSRSLIWNGMNCKQTEVKIAKNKVDLERILTTYRWLESNPFMIQEFIEGHGAGVFALYDKGKPVAFFSHKRLREKPPQGGVSVVSTSTPLNPNLLGNAKKLLDNVKWHGVAMVEFRVTNDGTPYLMEVNTRFWGSLQLAIDAGVDFPRLLFRISNNEKVELENNYRIGAKLRWFLGDFDSLYLVLKSNDYSLKTKIKRIMSFLKPDFVNTKHQVARRNDWRPGIEELKQYLNALTK